MLTEGSEIVAKRVVGSLFILSILFIVAVLIPSARGAIRDSHHDFSGASWSDGEICIPCHTPHDADLDAPDAPLWNHEVTSTTFTLYSSPTLDATPSQPGGLSQLCLSCHDGTVAVDSFAGASGTRYVSGRGLIGTVLTSHHPVSFVYDTALSTKDGELADPKVANSGLGGTIAKDLLRSDRLECVSCHDVHIGRNTQGCSGCHNTHGGPLYKESLSLWKANAGSAFCLTCHTK